MQIDRDASPDSDIIGPIRRDELDAVFRLKHGDPESAGWAPRRRQQWGYDPPENVYEAMVARLVRPETRWADVGCGRSLFPENPTLAVALAGRCARLVGIDPDETLEDNPYVHEKARVPIEDYQSESGFDLITLRMVAEHIADPARVVSALARLSRPGALVVVLTVNRWSPVALGTRAIPFGLHHPIKRVLWKTERRDTFPVSYRLNTRGDLRRVFEAGGFVEASFAYLDDCQSFGRFRFLGGLELAARSVFRKLGLTYPENCLLGVYRHAEDPDEKASP
jgi:SAM-dependent methyltransferase